MYLPVVCCILTQVFVVTHIFTLFAAVGVPCRVLLCGIPNNGIRVGFGEQNTVGEVFSLSLQHCAMT